MRHRKATCCGVPIAASHCSICFPVLPIASAPCRRGMPRVYSSLDYLSSYLLDTTLAFLAFLRQLAREPAKLPFAPT